MAAKPSLRLLALCELCWLEDHTNWEPESMDESGHILMKLVGVDTPEVTNFGVVDICCMCGSITICGIYQMMDPNKVYFLDENEESLERFEFDIGILDED